MKRIVLCLYYCIVVSFARSLTYYLVDCRYKDFPVADCGSAFSFYYYIRDFFDINIFDDDFHFSYRHYVRPYCFSARCLNYSALFPDFGQYISLMITQASLTENTFMP